MSGRASIGSCLPRRGRRRVSEACALDLLRRATAVGNNPHHAHERSARRWRDRGRDGLIGPPVFLDLWAVRHLTHTDSADLRSRFVKALIAAGGSLLVSSVWGTELQTILGDARTRVQALFSSLGAHWLLINPIVSAVVEREARYDLGAYLSEASLSASCPSGPESCCGAVLIRTASRTPSSSTSAGYWSGRTRIRRPPRRPRN
jgi:hypothetical protein